MATTVHTPPADLVRRLRLSGEESQQVFRALLDTLSRPGHIVALPNSVTDRMPPALVPAAALADVEVTLAVLSGTGDEAWGAALIAATGARTVPLDLAQMVVGLRALSPTELLDLERGDASAPERGARVSIACRSLIAGRGDMAIGPSGLAVSLQGPGVDGNRSLLVEGLDAEVLLELAEANRTFPAGIDAWLVADDGRVIGLPRTTSLTVETVGGSNPQNRPDPDQRGAS